MKYFENLHYVSQHIVSMNLFAFYTNDKIVPLMEMMFSLVEFVDHHISLLIVSHRQSNQS